MKIHQRRIVGDVKLTYEELSALLAQIESCLNSRPLVPLANDDDGIAPGHSLIARPLHVLPDVCSTNDSIILLRRWQLSKLLLRRNNCLQNTLIFTTWMIYEVALSLYKQV